MERASTSGSSIRFSYPTTARVTPLAAAHWTARSRSRAATAAGKRPASRREGRNSVRAILAVPTIPHRTVPVIVITRPFPGHYPGMADLFRGVGVALLTMFGDDGAVDPGSTGDLAADLVERGMRAVLVAGTTGEAPTLADADRCALIEPDQVS